MFRESSDLGQPVIAISQRNVRPAAGSGSTTPSTGVLHLLFEKYPMPLVVLLASELLEKRLQRQLAGYKLLIMDEPGYVLLSPSRAELLFDVISQRYQTLAAEGWTSSAVVQRSGLKFENRKN